MKIISKFRDYYDIGLGQGIDEDVVFVRKTNDPYAIGELKAKSHRRRYRHNEITPITVGFCGEAYTGLIVQCFEEGKEGESFVYNSDELFSFFESRNIPKKNWIIDIPLPVSIRLGINTNSTEAINKLFIHYPTDEYFHKHQAPIWCVVEHTVVINPKLEELMFYKVKDAFTAFQEIQSYISGVLLSKENEMVEISDDHRLEAHGYDQYSFRQPPGRKKRKNKR